MIFCWMSTGILPLIPECSLKKPEPTPSIIWGLGNHLWGLSSLGRHALHRFGPRLLRAMRWYWNTCLWQFDERSSPRRDLRWSQCLNNWQVLWWSRRYVFVSNLSGTYQCARALWTVQFYLWTVQFFGQGLVDSPILSGPAQMILFWIIPFYRWMIDTTQS